MEEVSESQYLGETTIPDIRITIFEAVKHNEVAPPYVMFGIRTEVSWKQVDFIVFWKYFFFPSS
jgi:hypothetical protein